MPRGGLSSDSKAKQNQLDGLARGREKQARRLLGLDEEDGGAAAPPASTKPAAPPREQKPRASKTKKGTYGKPRPTPRKEAGSARPASGDPPEPEPERPRRGGFLGGLIGGIADF